MSVIPLPEAREMGDFGDERSLIVSASLPPYVDAHIGVNINRLQRVARLGLLSSFAITSSQGPDREYQLGGNGVNADGSVTGFGAALKRPSLSEATGERVDERSIGYFMREIDVEIELHRQELEHRAKDKRPNNDYDDPRLWSRMLNRTLLQQTSKAMIETRLNPHADFIGVGIDGLNTFSDIVRYVLASDKPNQLADTIQELGFRAALLTGAAGLISILRGEGKRGMAIRTMWTSTDRSAIALGYLAARPIFKPIES